MFDQKIKSLKKWNDQIEKVAVKKPELSQKTVHETVQNRNGRVWEGRLIPYRKITEAGFAVFYRKPLFAPEL
jgi:hypothetical protein